MNKYIVIFKELGRGKTKQRIVWADSDEEARENAATFQKKIYGDRKNIILSLFKQID